MDINRVKYGGGRKGFEKEPYVFIGKDKERLYGKIITCCVCKKEYFTPTHRLKRGNTYCSPQCAGKKYAGEKSPKWAGGRILLQNGYIERTIPDNHPLKLKGKRYIAEHRFIMEKHIGRYLKPYELMHHLNGNKEDNRIENLALCSLKNHYEFIKKLQERIEKLESDVEFFLQKGER